MGVLLQVHNSDMVYGQLCCSRMLRVGCLTHI